MRTTIDIPEREHAMFMGMARAQQKTLGKLLLELAQRGLNASARGMSGKAAFRINPATGLPLFRSGKPVTLEDVRALEDEC